MEKLKLTSTVFGPNGKITFFVYSFILSPDRLLYKLHVLQLYQQWMYLGQDSLMHVISYQSGFEFRLVAIPIQSVTAPSIPIHSVRVPIIHTFLLVVDYTQAPGCGNRFYIFLLLAFDIQLRVHVAGRGVFCPSEVFTCTWSPDKVIQC